MLFDQFFSPYYDNSSTGSAIVKNTKDAWVIEMDMPGVQKDKVEVNAVGRILEIKGERQKGEGRTLTYKERFQLPDHLRSAEGVSAEMNLGVLTVKVPKGISGAISIPVLDTAG